MAWPPRSPDFIPVDVFLWDHIKALIYTSPVDSEKDIIALLLRKQQPGILLSADVSFCFFVIGCVSRSVAARLNICTKVVTN